MKLFFREYGANDPVLIILHGLYGNSDNWVSVARRLQDDFHVYLPDQRNHGHSPHDPEMNYNVMTADLYEFFKEHRINKAHLIGHSMGGKTAMHFTLKHPELIKKLAVLDIAPKTYASSGKTQIIKYHSRIIKALTTADIGHTQSRTTIDQQLTRSLPSRQLRQFLLKNIERTKSGRYLWRLNLPVIKESLEYIMDGFSHLNPKDHNSDIPSLFIRGEKSGYVRGEDTLIIHSFFKNTEITSIPDAGHWLHAEQPDLLIKTLNKFLSNK